MPSLRDESSTSATFSLNKKLGSHSLQSAKTEPVCLMLSHGLSVLSWVLNTVIQTHAGRLRAPGQTQREPGTGSYQAFLSSCL